MGIVALVDRSFGTGSKHSAMKCGSVLAFSIVNCSLLWLLLFSCHYYHYRNCATRIPVNMHLIENTGGYPSTHYIAFYF